MSVPPGDTARSGHCSSGVCALCPRAVGKGATLDVGVALFPARPADWDPRPSRLVAGFEPCHRYSCARSRTATVPQAGLEPARPFGHVSLNHARMPAFATEGCSPCLLAKGTDCAGDVLPVWGVVICRSLP